MPSRFGWKQEKLNPRLGRNSSISDVISLSKACGWGCLVTYSFGCQMTYTIPWHSFAVRVHVDAEGSKV